jgi:hypothetical protein
MPLSDAETTLPSGMDTKAEISLISVRPNLPTWPCSFSPVKVLAIDQNLTWPLPDVTMSPSLKRLNATLYTSAPNALLRRMICSCSHAQIVRTKSGSMATVASMAPLSEKRHALYPRSAPLRSVERTLRDGYSYTMAFGSFGCFSQTV